MLLRAHPWIGFLCIGALCFVATTVVSEVATDTYYRGTQFWSALSESGRRLVAEPIASAYLSSPFLVLAAICASLVKRGGLTRALILFVAGGFILVAFYFSAHQDVHRYMERRMWTAASLAVGLLPLNTVPVLLICLGLRWLFGRQSETAKA